MCLVYVEYNTPCTQKANLHQFIMNKFDVSLLLEIFIDTIFIVWWTWFSGRRGPYRMVVGFTTNYAIIAITNNVASSNLAHVEVNSIQHYVIKFDIDLR